MILVGIAETCGDGRKGETNQNDNRLCHQVGLGMTVRNPVLASSNHGGSGSQSASANLSRGIWRASLVRYDLGYIDLEQKTL
jgi:hypothetical protein